MPFENFYKESDKSARRHWGWIIMLSGFSLIGSYLFLLFLPSLLENIETGNNEIPSKAERLEAADAICSDLPEPERFVFVGRDRPIEHKGATEVIYRYKTDREFDELVPVFTVWFASNGWTPDPDSKMSFNKGMQRISIKLNENYYYYGALNYEISCYQSSFGIYD